MMDKDQLIAAINLLLEDADPPPENLHELHFRLMETINELIAMGESVPDDLARFKRELEEAIAEAHARENRAKKHGERHKTREDEEHDKERKTRDAKT